MEFKNLLFEKKKTLSVEYNPPKNYNINIDNIKSVAQFIDVVNVTDCPMASLRMSSIASSYIIEHKLNLPTIFNLTCRDRNALGISSDLLGAWALGLRSVLAINGDVIKNRRKENVYQLNTSKLLKIIKKLNNAEDYLGNSIKLKTDFLCGVASNVPTKASMRGIKNRLKVKAEYGADFVITQPVYSIESLEMFLEVSKDVKISKIIGFFPPPNLKVANYLNDSVKGIEIPKQLIDDFKNSKDEKSEGFVFVQNLIDDIVKRGYLKDIDGIHLMRFEKNFVEHIFNIIRS